MSRTDAGIAAELAPAGLRFLERDRALADPRASRRAMTEVTA
jgi:hypothetical protein